MSLSRVTHFHILLWRYQLWSHLPEDSRCPESSEGHGARCCRWLWPRRPSSLLHDVWCYPPTGRQNTLRVNILVTTWVNMCLFMIH